MELLKVIRYLNFIHIIRENQTNIEWEYVSVSVYLI